MADSENKYSQEEKLEVYFESTEQTADERLSFFQRQTLDRKDSPISNRDLIEMEIEEFEERLSKNKLALRKANIGNTEMENDPSLFEYLKDGLKPENSEWTFQPFINEGYNLFLVVVDYKYLQKLKNLLGEKKPKEKYKTRQERVDRVEEIKRKKQCSYPDAIEQFNNEMEEDIYNGYPSFNTQRNKVYGNN